MAEEPVQHEEVVEKTLWIFEYSTGRRDITIKHLYARDEEEARRVVSDFIKKAEIALDWERLKHAPGGFSTGSTEFLGRIHVRPDGTIVEGRYRTFIK